MGNMLRATMLTVHLLRENTDMSFKDIGECLGISVVYAQKLYGKALKDDVVKEALEKMLQE